MAVLEFECPHFRSAGDERALFDWLERLHGVSRVRGRGTVVRFSLSEPVSDETLREVLGLYWRYGIDPGPLAGMETSENRHWFRAAGTFWYASVFGET